ncbi:hypothetical protein BC628DRAFT_1383984 [Trametes gibbosa]|nr:hypothetical protein BC628DRAFT_1383984 [Trametes gibbosa]
MCARATTLPKRRSLGWKMLLQYASRPRAPVSDPDTARHCARQMASATNICQGRTPGVLCETEMDETRGGTRNAGRRTQDGGSLHIRAPPPLESRDLSERAGCYIKTWNKIRPTYGVVHCRAACPRRADEEVTSRFPARARRLHGCHTMPRRLLHEISKAQGKAATWPISWCRRGRGYRNSA